LCILCLPFFCFVFVSLLLSLFSFLFCFILLQRDPNADLCAKETFV
jgi:hypothetical protein